MNELQDLRTAIVNFHQNMRTLYNDLYQSSGKTPSNKIIFDMYHPFLENIKSAGVFSKTFTFEQIQNHIRYLIGIIRPLVSSNILAENKIKEKHGEFEGFQNLVTFGKNIQDSFVPLANSLRVPETEAELIEKAPTFSDLLNRVGANLVSYVRQYVLRMSTASRADYLSRWATIFEEQIKL